MGWLGLFGAWLVWRLIKGPEPEYEAVIDMTEITRLQLKPPMIWEQHIKNVRLITLAEVSHRIGPTIARKTGDE